MKIHHQASRIPKIKAVLFRLAKILHLLYTLAKRYGIFELTFSKDQKTK